jgi:hypothetical protein
MMQTKQHTFTLLLQRTWRDIFGQPFAWLFLCFFQPTRFEEEFEHRYFAQRVTLMLKLALSLFLFSLLIALPVQLFLFNCVNSCTSFDPSFLTLNVLSSIFEATFLGIVCGLIIGVLGDIGLGILLGMALGITGIVVGNADIALLKGSAVACVLGLVIGTARGFKWGMWRGVIGGILCGLTWGVMSFLLQGPTQGIAGGMQIALLFLASYAIGYYRLPLYPVSGPAALLAYLASKKKPSRVIVYLHASSLYWDERVFLPLPYLQRTLLRSAEQDEQQALKEIAFIIDKRPQQQQAALAASLEITLRDMQARETIRDIAGATQRFSELLSLEDRLMDRRWVTLFARLSDASREATRYYGPLSWRNRHDALEKMLAALAQIYPDTAFADMQLKTLLSSVVTHWRVAIRYEQEKLEQGSESFGQIMNPFDDVGQVLKPQDTRFVGRRDLVRQLSESLSREGNRPTFLLNGERRMGKSSTLKQLPNLLGASYIPILFDLQDPGISSSIDVFLSKLAEGIYKAMSQRGMSIAKIENMCLREALHRNEAAVYPPFNEWLDQVESVLARENRTVLLLFDEFEKLEEAGTERYLNLNLLLNWFRTTIQNRSYVALLFSGVRTFGDMGASWAGYFVNAKTMRVSFLRPAEARHLITQPVPNFPYQEVFGEGVVEEIIRVTGGHPFLLQAVCAELIEDLNIENRERAEIEDVNAAVQHVFDHWWDTYFRDLWERSDQQQRACLKLLSQAEGSDVLSLAQQSGIGEQTLLQTLQTLLKRDLVLLDQHCYCMAAPIFCQWVERSI